MRGMQSPSMDTRRLKGSKAEALPQAIFPAQPDCTNPLGSSERTFARTEQKVNLAPLPCWQGRPYLPAGLPRSPKAET